MSQCHNCGHEVQGGMKFCPTCGQDVPLRRRLWEWLGFGAKAEGEKTGLDLLMFLVTASIPIIVALGGLWFTADQNSNREWVEEQRAQDGALQAYLAEMGRLLLEGDLRNSEVDAEIRSMAKARTSTVLSRLNVTRRADVVQFLHDSKLIDTNPIHPYGFPGVPPPIIMIERVDLWRAQLIGVDLRGAYLQNANLRDADLGAADLGGAFLVGADLSGAKLDMADLRGADLVNADLRGANLRQALLSDARLGEADLTDADLDGAYMVDADLDGATVPPEQLEASGWLEGAIMPDACVTLLRPSCPNYLDYSKSHGYFVPSENVPPEVSTPAEGTSYACIGSPFRYAPDKKDNDYYDNTCEPLQDGPPADAVCDHPTPFKLSGHRVQAFVCN